MIWNSVPLMTAFDLLIIAVAGYAMWHSRPIGAGRRALAQRFGWLLVTVGLLAVCLFYLADLVSMYVLPETESEQAAMTFMEALHRTLSWPVVLIISFGFVEMLRELQRREARLRRLVDSNIIGVFTWGSNGRIIDANDAFLRIVGYLRDDLVSGRLRWQDLTPAEWRDLDARAVAEVR